MNIIVDLLPEYVEIDGDRCQIRTDFRISILFELMMQDDELSDGEKVRQALNLYYPVIPQNHREAAEKLIWFYRCGKELDDYSYGSGASETGKPVYSFEYDADYIYSAFRGQYGIDLQDIRYMHWWKFRAMFKALKDDNEFVKIMGYRSMKITNKMSKEQKEFFKRMQRIHALPTSSRQREEDIALIEALKNGGDLTGLI